jgi:hypothetical protein
MTDQSDDDYRAHLRRRLVQSNVPGPLHEGLIEYFAARRPTGSFLHACLENDLTQACLRASGINRVLLYNSRAIPDVLCAVDGMGFEGGRRGLARRPVVGAGAVRMRWPWGKRAIIDEHGVREILAADHPVEHWVCCRVDEPWTWQVLTNQYFGTCASCAADIIYRVSERSPTDDAVKKICRRCADRMAAEP